ncbi:MAG TPA: hypothetical protein VLS93_08780 [Anaeromyxobacteraceae bacterium]|nr:hypothetical protein [Anaeromyxobacteraceae bacterium]
MSLLGSILSAARRALLGISAEEIRYTFEDLRGEIRAVRAELKEEIAEVRREAAARGGEDRPEGPEIPVAEA